MPAILGGQSLRDIILLLLLLIGAAVIVVGVVLLVGRDKKLHLKNISFILSRNWRHAGRHSYLLREKCLLYENGYSLRITKHNASFSSLFFSFHLKTFILPCEVNATLKHTVDHFSFR